MKRHLTTLAAAVALTVVAGAAWAYWSAGSVPGGNGAAAASSVNQGATPSASVNAQSVTVSWAATTLANGQPVTGYVVKRYDSITQAAQTVLAGCAGTVTGTSCVENNVPTGLWRYSVTPVVGANWQGAESAKSGAVTVLGLDPTAPTNSLTLSSVSGGAYLSGTTVFYRGTAAGSLRLTNAVSDAGSGPASSQTVALTGTSTGWTHTPSTVSSPAGGPYVSNAFDWSAATTSGPGEAVTGRDVAGNTAVTNLTFANDSTPPGAGTISYADGFAANRSVSVSFTSGTDAGSGIATRRVQRATAPLTGSTCGAFGAFADIGTDTPTSPYADGSLWGACFQYRYVVTDRVGNQDVATSASVVKIGYAAGVAATTGLLSQWRLGEGGQSLISTDSFTDTTGTSLAAHTAGSGTTWTRVDGTSGVNSVITDQGRVRRSGTGYTIYTASQTPATADYSVEADFHYKSSLSGDMSGVLGRYNGTTGYLARYERSDQSWDIVKVSATSTVSYGPAGSSLVGQALTAGESYRVRLELSGASTTTVKLFVNGVQKAIWVDSSSPITAAGKAGLYDGNVSPTPTVTKGDTGLHLDNLQVTPSTYPRAADSKGSNTGDYQNGVVLGAPGALVADPNTAATFDGLNDAVIVPDAASLRPANLTLEAWVKPTAGIPDYSSVATKTTLNIWNDSYGMYAWQGGIDFWVNDDANDVWTSALPANSWTHVAGTYDGSTIKIYMNGVLADSTAYAGPLVHSTAPLLIGDAAGTGNYHWNGGLDEVALYNRALTATEILEHYQLGGVAAGDTTGPTGGSVDASGLVGTGARYATSTTLSLGLAKGTDPSGVATTGNQLLRATGTLTNGTCGTLGSYSLVTGGTDPATPKTDTVADHACYSYRYAVLDTVGNATTYTSPDIKVDTTAPSTPTLAFSAFTNTYWSGSGSTVYYRSAAASGSVTTTATASDAASGVLSYAFPALGTNWTSTPGALGANTYSWSGAPASPATKNVTATNNAALTSANSPFTMTADSTAPTAGTVTYIDGDTGAATLSVGFTQGTDGGSGLGTRLLQRAAATWVDGACGAFGAFATVTGGTNPTSPVVDSTVTSGSCYKYQYVVADNVGNAHTASSASIAVYSKGAFWAFNAGTGTGAVDGSGHGFTGTLQAGAGWTTGRVGSNALNLTGAANSFVDVTPAVIDTSRSYSVAAWVKPNNLTGFQTLTTIEGTSNSPFFLQMQAGTLQFTATSTDSPSAVGTTVTGSLAAVGTWVHVVAVHNNVANTVTLYVNGVAQSSAAFNSPWQATGHTVIGRAKRNGAPVDFTNGAIDEVGYYDRVLTGTEITNLAAQ